MFFPPRMLLIFFIASALPASAGILPDIFYHSPTERSAFCEDKTSQNEEFWKELMENKIQEHIDERNEIIQNTYVTLSYLELSKLTQNSSSVKFMGYVYAHASHHLGRLLRFHKWPKDHPLKKKDQDMIKGDALRFIVIAANMELSKRLMSHSLKLYLELSWSLGAASLCGHDYVLEMSQNELLSDAYSKRNVRDFITSFVSFEQGFLQRNMYQEFLIGTSAKAGVLDEMRFIPFNGELQLSFRGWCEKRDCGTTSHDLLNRIEFDAYSILQELELTRGNMEIIRERILKSSIEETAEVFLSSSFDGTGRLSP